VSAGILAWAPHTRQEMPLICDFVQSDEIINIVQINQLSVTIDTNRLQMPQKVKKLMLTARKV